MNAHNLGQQTDYMTIDQFEAESIDERHTADFDGKLSAWWCEFWTSFAASVARETKQKSLKEIFISKRNLK